MIAEFLDLVAETAADRTLTLADVQSLPFMKFWSHLVIFRHEPDREDFRVSFFGTSVVKSYGEDWTGRLLSQSGFTLGCERIHRVNCEVMEKRIVVAESGDLNWQDRDHVKWHQVKLPLSRNGDISDVLTIICFE